MAAGVGSRKASPVETLVERRIGEVCRRIRRSEAGAAALLFGAAVGAYALGFAVADLAVGGADAGWPLVGRWVAWVFFVALAGGLAVDAVRRLVRRVNPYFAARRLEATVPDAKNSVISWLDLRDEPLPPAFRKTLGGKAAHDLEAADPERAVDRRPAWLRLGVFCALLLGLLVLLAARPGQFFSLMHRAFVPSYHGQLAGETRITLLRPDAGDVVVTERQPVLFVARIDGRVPEVNQPGAPALRYRYQPGDTFVVQPLQQDAGGHWTTRLAADQVGSTGLWYQITAGDAQTPLYQVSVRAQPLVQRYEVSYRYRPYLRQPPETVVFPNQHAALPFVKRHRGTEVSLVVRTNRPLRQGSVLLVTGKAKKDLPTQVLGDDPRAFRCRWTLEQSGEFFVAFTSVEGETFTSRVPFPVDALADTTPTAELTVPGKDVELPANGTLELAGFADDDLGIKELTLRLQLLGGAGPTPLKAQPYRPGTSLDLDGKGTYPVHVDYVDVVKLDELRTLKEQTVRLAAGAVVEYWLEATDNSDYPNRAGNVGKSASYRIKVLPPQDEAVEQAKRDQALKKQQRHHQQQDQKRADEKQKQEASVPPAGGPAKDQADQLGNELKNDLNRLDQPNTPSDKGSAKGDPPPGRSEDKPGAGAPSPAQKDQKPGDGSDAGSPKSGPPPAGADSKPGQAKDAGAPNDAQAPPRSGNDAPQPGAGQPQSDPMKGAPKEGPSDNPGQSKDGGPPQPGQQQPAQGKDGSPDAPQPGQSPQAKGADSGKDAPTAQAKPGGGPSPGAAPQGVPPDQPPQGFAKPEEATGPRSISKAAGAPTDPKAAAPAEKGPGGGTPVGAEKADAKTPPKGEAKDLPAMVKDGGPEPPQAKAGPQRPPTPQDVQHFKDLAKRKDGIGAMAQDALEQMSKEAVDPKVRDLAKEALNEVGPKQTPGDFSSGAKDPMATQAPPPDGPPGNPAQGNPGKTKEGPRANPQPGKTASTSPQATGNEAKGSGGLKPGPGSRPGDDGKPDPARKDLARFGGSLQLEDFIKRATPEYRAKAGISDAEWQQFLDRAAEYDQLLRTLPQPPRGKTPRDARGTPGSLAGVAPGQVQGPHDAGAIGDPGRAETPPELLDAQRLFTGGKKVGPMP